MWQYYHTMKANAAPYGNQAAPPSAVSTGPLPQTVPVVLVRKAPRQVADLQDQLPLRLSSLCHTLVCVVLHVTASC